MMVHRARESPVQNSSSHPVHDEHEPHVPHQQQQRHSGRGANSHELAQDNCNVLQIVKGRTFIAMNRKEVRWKDENNGDEGDGTKRSCNRTINCGNGDNTKDDSRSFERNDDHKPRIIAKKRKIVSYNL